jgi:hypothetical protein
MHNLTVRIIYKTGWCFLIKPEAEKKRDWAVHENTVQKK